MPSIEPIIILILLYIKNIDTKAKHNRCPSSAGPSKREREEEAARGLQREERRDNEKGPERARRQ